MAQSGNVWSTLVAKVRAGDDAARSQLVATVERVLRAFFGARLSRPREVDDRVMNTLLRMDRGLRHELKQPWALKAFAPKPALFELHDHYRGRYGLHERIFDSAVPPRCAALT